MGSNADIKLTAQLDITQSEKQVLKDIQQLQNMITQSGRNKIKLELAPLDDKSMSRFVNTMNSINASGKAGTSVFNTFGSTLKDALSMYSMINIYRKGFYEIAQAGGDAVKSVKAFDDANVSLQMATGESYNSVKKLMEQYNQMGQELGAITTDVSDAADAWLRQGHTVEDTNKLIKDSLMLTKLANLNSADSTKYLTSAMQGYKVAVDDVVGVVDKLTAVDLESATDAGGLALAMSRTAESANIAGVSMDRLIGMIATVGEVTQKPMSSIGESFKTIFSRMRDISDNKLSIVGDNGDIEDLSKVEIVLGQLGIKLRDSNKEFRNFQTVLDDVAKGWNGYSSVQQAAIAKAFSGVRQQENFLVMMENWDKVKEYTNVAVDSMGTATGKFDSYLDGLEAKTNALRASFEDLANTTISKELYASILDTSKKVVNFTNETGVLKGALAGLGTAGSLYAVQQLSIFAGNAALEFTKFSQALNLIKTVNATSSMQELLNLTSGLSTSQTKLLLSTTNLTNAQRIEILMNQGLTQAQAINKLETMGLSAAQSGATATTATLSGALKGLWATLMANPLVLVATAVAATVTAFSSYENHIKKVKEETARASEEIRSSVDETIRKFDSQRQSLDGMKDRFTELSKGVDDYGNNISLTSDQMDEYNGLVKKLIEMNPTVVKGYDAENQAIINKNTALQDTIDLLEKEQKLELSKELSTNNLETVGKGAVDKRNDLYGIGSPYDKSGNLRLDTVSGQAERFGIEAAKIFNDESVKAFYDYTNSRPFEKLYGKSDWLKTFGFDVADENIDLDITGFLQRNIGTFANNMDEILTKAGIDPKSDTGRNLKLYAEEWKTLNTELSSLDNTYIDSYLQKVPQLVDGYGKLNDAQKSFITDYIKNSFSGDDLANDATKVKTSIMGIVADISADPKIKSGINDLFALDTKNLNVEDYVKQYNDLVNQIISKLDLSDSEASRLKLNLTIDSSELEEKYKNAISDAQNKFGKDETAFFRANSINSKEEIDKWLAIAQGAKTATEAERKYVESGKNIVPTLTKPEIIGNINALSDGFESLDKIMNSVKDKKPFDYSLLDDKKFKDTFNVSGVEEEYAKFIETISSTPNDVKATQSAFDNLVTTWLDSTGTLKGLTDENANLAISMLKNMGVANADEVVTSRLAQAQAELAAEKYYNANASDSLSNATIGEVNAFVDEGTAAGVSKQALADLALQKLAVNNVSIDTSSDIDQVINLANAAGASATVLAKLANAKAIMAKAEQGALNGSVGDLKQYEYAQQLLQDIENGTFDFQTTLDPNKFKTAIYTGGTKTNNPTKEKTKKEFKETFDWIAVAAEQSQKKVEKLQDQIADADNWKAKNKVTDTTIEEMLNQIKALEAEADAYQKKADSYEVSPVYLDKIKNGTLEIEDITDELVAKNVKGYQDMYNKAEDFRSKVDDVKKSMKELAQSRLDNIINDFDSLISLSEKYASYNKNLVNLQKDLGKEITDADYEQLINQQTGIYNELQNKYQSLSKELSKAVSAGTIKTGDEAWRKYNSELIDVNSSMLDIVSSMNDFRKSMLELPFEELNQFTNSVNLANSQISAMIELLGDEGLTDNGMITSKGLTKIALLGQEYTNAKQQAANYAEAIDAVNEMYSNGSITQAEYNDKINEYTSAQLSAVKATKDAEDAIIQFRKNAIQEQITNMNDLITAKKDALKAEKDYQDYLDSVNKKQTDINNLQAKIDELSLRSDPTDRASIAQRLQLEKQLKDAKDELAKQQADNAYNQQLEGLDKQAKNYEDAKNNELKELESSTEAQRKVIQDYLGQVKDNYKTVYNTLTQYGKDYGVKMTDELTSPWKSAGNAVDTFQSAVSDAIAQINIDIASIDLSNLTELVSAVQGLSGGGSSGGFEDVTGTGTWQKTSKGWWYGSSNDDYVSDGIYTIGGKQYSFNEDGYMNTGWNDDSGEWRYFEPENGQMVKSTWRKAKNGKEYYLKSDGTMATDMAIKSKSGNEYYYVDDEGVYNGKPLSYDEVKRQNITVGYKNGTLSTKDELALMDEEGTGSELMNKQGTLMQFKGGDAVFDKVKTTELWNFANNPNSYLSDKLMRNQVDLSSAMTVNKQSYSPIEINSPLINVEGSADRQTLVEVGNMITNRLKNELPVLMMKSSKKSFLK